MKNPKLELVGHVGVDAGLIYIGDPCYEIGSDASEKFAGTWSDFCTLLVSSEDSGILKLPYKRGHEGKAVVVSSGYGDGNYPVYVERKDGRIARVSVDFMPEEDKDDS